MTWKDGRKIIEARRERVAQLRLRGLTMREIMAALESQGMVNPETGKSFGLGTLSKDYGELDKQWRANAARSTDEHKSEQLAEIAEVKRSAWASKKPDVVLRAMQLEAKILGTEAPVKAEVFGKDGGPLLLRVIEQIVGDECNDPAAPHTGGVSP